MTTIVGYGNHTPFIPGYFFALCVKFLRGTLDTRAKLARFRHNCFATDAPISYTAANGDRSPWKLRVQKVRKSMAEEML